MPGGLVTVEDSCGPRPHLPVSYTRRFSVFPHGRVWPPAMGVFLVVVYTTIVIELQVWTPDYAQLPPLAALCHVVRAVWGLQD